MHVEAVPSPTQNSGFWMSQFGSRYSIFLRTLLAKSGPWGPYHYLLCHILVEIFFRFRSLLWLIKHERGWDRCMRTLSQVRWENMFHLQSNNLWQNKCFSFSWSDDNDIINVGIFFLFFFGELLLSFTTKFGA